MVTKFKAGDRVRCVESVDPYYNVGAPDITVGGVYTVAESYEDDEYDPGPYVRLESRPGMWRTDRFEKVVPNADVPVNFYREGINKNG